MTVPLRNRIEAGRLLARELQEYANGSDLLVLGIPRGGVPVAFEIAKALHLPLDICLVRKLGAPQNPELAMGAIALGDVMTLDEELVRSRKISQKAIEETIEREQKELARRDRLYRGDRPFPEVNDRTVILVDDGIATGSSILAAIATLQPQHPKAIVVAVPVASPSTCGELKSQVDRVVCLMTPKWLCSISLWYEDFSQTSDEAVRKLLNQATFHTSNQRL